MVGRPVAHMMAVPACVPFDETVVMVPPSWLPTTGDAAPSRGRSGNRGRGLYFLQTVILGGAAVAAACRLRHIARPRLGR